MLRGGLSTARLIGQKEVLPRFLLLGIVALFILNIYPCLLTRFDYPALEQKYKNWKADPGNLECLISDDEVYAYAGWRYVNGASPDEINFEHPPFAKYLIGISEVLFNNPNAIGAALGVLSLLILYGLSKRLLGHSLFALAPVYMLSLERVFIAFSSISMLDIYLVFFLLLSIYLSGEDSRSKVLVGAVVLGLATACKLPALLIAPVFFLPVTAKKKREAWKVVVQGIFVAALAYCLCYAQFFVAGHSLADFFELQQRMFLQQYGMRYERVHSSGRLLLTLLTGIIGPETRTWIIVDEAARLFVTVATKHGLSIAREFNPLTWPLCFSGAVLSTCQAIKKRNTELFRHCAYFFSLLVPLSLGQSFVWYLLPVLPVGLLLLASNLKEIADGKMPSMLMLTYMGALLLWQRLLTLPLFIELA